MSMIEPPNRGLPYSQREIDEIVAAAQKPGARRPEVLQALADRFGRTPDAIDFVIRWAQGGQFPKRARNRIMRQVALALEKIAKRLKGE